MYGRTRKEKVMDALNEVMFVFGMLACVAVFCFVSLGIAQHISFHAEVAEVEQVRRAVEASPPSSNEDVYGQAVEMNRMIAEYRVYDSVPIIGITVPNGWNDVEMIDL